MMFQPCTVSDFELPKLVECIIQPYEWLNDKQIDHSVAMMRLQFPHINGLQSIFVFEQKFLQHVGGENSSMCKSLPVTN